MSTTLHYQADLFCHDPHHAPHDHELVIDNFAGGGGASIGIAKAIKRSVDIAINHDVEALRMHQENHPDTRHYCENILEIDPVKVCAGRPVGMAWFSPDCFPAGTLILTSKGYVPIEEIETGDLVLTHTGQYRPVTSTMQSEKHLVKISGQGHPGMMVSEEHPIYTRQARNVWNNQRRAYDRTLDGAEWRRPSDLRTAGAPTNAAGGDLSFWATPCTFPELPIPEIGGRSMTITPELMWLCGRYVGDGWTRLTKSRAEIVITCSKLEVESLRPLLNRWTRTDDRCGLDELAWHERNTKTAYQFSANHRGLVKWLRAEFGHRAESKGLPSWVLGMPTAMRLALLEGYCSADGHSREISGGTVSEISTVSKNLAFSVRSLVESLGMTGHVHGPYTNRNAIEGRTVNARPVWGVRWREKAQRKQNLRDGIHNWLRIQKVEDLHHSETVYNLSVEDDESYVAEGVVVHNCTHHSKAKGGKPRKKEIRALAWVVVKWAAKVRPRVIFLENVEEFQDWCPLDENGQPMKERKGETFRLWVSQLEALGYVVEWRLLSAHDYGAPTTRKRLFLVARCDGQPITWPKPTHGKGKGLKPYRTAAECLDFSIPCPSIFLSKEEARTMGVIRPLAENTLKRIAKGLKRYVLDEPNPFIIAYHSQETFRGQGIDEPLRTQTTENRFAVVAPTLVQTGYGERPGQAPRCLDLQKPLGTVVAGGSKHALVSTFIAKHYGGVVGHGVDRPLGTVTTVDHHSFVSAFMERHAANAHVSRKDMLSAFFVKYYGCGDGAPVTESMHTITTKDRFGLVQVHGQDYEIVDIGLRMLQPRELARAQGMPEDYKLPGTKTRQVRCIGNSVSPPPAEALVRANYRPARATALGATA